MSLYANNEAAVHQAQHGDLEAFEWLIRSHASAVVSFLHRFMPNPDDAEDIAQETFVKAFCCLSRYNPSQGQFRNWLFQIAANTSLDELKRRKREAAKMAAARLEGNEAIDAWSSETESESVAVIRTALQSIPAPQRQVVLLSYYHDLTWQEIANTLGIPLGTVKSRMHGALTRLRGLLVTEKDGEIR